jgi:hypothetical protein
VDRDQLTEHLKFAAELGVAGVSRDPAWRTRQSDTLVIPRAQDERSAESSPARVASALDPARGDAHALEGAKGEPVTFSANAAEALAAVRADIGDCTRCKLHGQGRRQIVFGVGNPDADLMFVGEAPGADEDIQGWSDSTESDLVDWWREVDLAQDSWLLEDASGALAGRIPSKRLAEIARNECSHDTEDRRQHETRRLVLAGHDELSDHAGDKPDNDRPDETHGGLL